ncbi:hypothetical protein Cfor_04827 [Coptotermes formosanus]|uniref:Uncharacterized protein n=1 Tax=Coptotermes formosanus TaxID=36987 RepID=A0A6L2PZW6_COPFO|nr:hypothetical protein Cfor_04827 [Coptotermes formosanus]
MVFFTCAHCGESLKKSKVEKHYQTLCSRKPVAVTCVDCCKDFSAETYPAHTKCVSEEEKYSAKGFVPRPSAHKGEYKQKKWQDNIQSLHKNQSSLSHDEQTILNAIVKRENVPRKKSKFQNFLRSFMKSQYNVQAADSVFDKVEALSKEEELKNKQDNQQEAENTGAIDDKNDIEEHDDSPSQETQADEKLSKKERKERRKRAKYEAELKEIEDNQVTQADVNGAQTGMSENTEIKEGGRLKKKHKKEETVSKNGISEDTELAKGKKSKKKQIDTGVTDIGDAEVSESGVSKKKRKKGQDAAEDMCRQEEPTKKKLKRNDTEEMAEEEAPHTAADRAKFNWQQIIVKVLESKEDKEMPLKRLQKKVLAEFEATGGGSATDVKTIAKFNKKVHKTPGVVVRKEVAKLMQIK